MVKPQFHRNIQILHHPVKERLGILHFLIGSLPVFDTGLILCGSDDGAGVFAGGHQMVAESPGQRPLQCRLGVHGCCGGNGYHQQVAQQKTEYHPFFASYFLKNKTQHTVSSNL